MKWKLLLSALVVIVQYGSVTANAKQKQMLCAGKFPFINDGIHGQR